MDKFINNWKIESLLREYSIEIIDVASQEFEKKIINDFNLPVKHYQNIDNAQTNIDWGKMPKYYCFFTEDFTEESIIENMKGSVLSKYESLIITFGWNETVAKVPTHLFLDDPLEFFFSKRWDGFICTEDFNLILETSHDYCVHSNFEIMAVNPHTLSEQKK